MIVPLARKSVIAGIPSRRPGPSSPKGRGGGVSKAFAEKDRAKRVAGREEKQRREHQMKRRSEQDFPMPRLRNRRVYRISSRLRSSCSLRLPFDRTPSHRLSAPALVIHARSRKSGPKLL